MNCVAIPEDETYVIPPRTSAPVIPQPRINASSAPGRKFTMRSKKPNDLRSRIVPINSPAVYSRPSKRRRRIAPHWAPRSKKLSLTLSGIKPPLPSASPAMRKIGTAENLKRAATKETRPRKRRTPPISARTSPVSEDAVAQSGMRAFSHLGISTRPFRSPLQRSSNWLPR